MERDEFEQRRREKLPLRREIFCSSPADIGQFNSVVFPVLMRYIEHESNGKYELEADRTGKDGCYLATNPVRYWEIKISKNWISSEYVGEIVPERLPDGITRIRFYILEQHWEALEKAIDSIVTELESDIDGLGTVAKSKPLVKTTPEDYVASSRLNELKSISSAQFDLSKLIRLCEELNACYTAGSYFASLMLVRAILDHVPPIFGQSSFSTVANNYSGGGKSFKLAMQRLESSCRKIADSYLHTQIRMSETLPNATQVNFDSELDLLLSEIVRVLKT